MNTKFKYKMLKQRAEQDANPDTLGIIRELEKQEITIRQQIKFSPKEERTAIAKKELQNKEEYSKLESKFAGWVYRSLQS